VVHEIALHDSRITYLKTPRQSNLPAVPRNIGIKHANGEYVAFLDHDDLWREKKLAIQIAEFEKDEKISMVYSPLWHFSGRNFFWGLILLRPPHKEADGRYLSLSNPIQCSSVVVKKDALIALGGFSENADLRAVEDYELWLRFSEKHKIKEIKTYHNSLILY
jgi:teichuronic acid biosynthesis glycosyltransferase TuaG